MEYRLDADNIDWAVRADFYGFEVGSLDEIDVEELRKYEI